METLRNIGQSVKKENGSLSEEALRLRLSEQYVKALHEVYHEGNIITLPASENAESSGISASTIATTFALYKQVLGNEGVALRSSERFAQQAATHGSSEKPEDREEMI